MARVVKEIKVKKLREDSKIPKKIKQGDWIDIALPEDIELEAGEERTIHLGLAMELPYGYEAHVVMRSSTYGRYKLIQTNGKGVIDESYNGNDDEWKLPVKNLGEDIEIEKGTKLCQFRIFRKQPQLKFTEVKDLENESRGGLGSTGK